MHNRENDLESIINEEFENSTIKEIFIDGDELKVDNRIYPIKNAKEKTWLLLGEKINTNQSIEHFGIRREYLFPDAHWPPSATIALGHVLKDHPTINQVSIVTSDFSDELSRKHMTDLLKCLNGKANILHLKITINTSPAFYLYLIAHILKQTSKQLKSISIYNNSNKNDVKGVLDFFESLQKQNRLEHLDLDNLSINDELIGEVQKKLSHISSLRTLRLKSLKVEKEFKTVYKIIANNPLLEALDLSYSFLGKSGGLALYQALLGLTQLQKLNLAHVALSPSVLEGLVTLHKQNKLKLTELSLNHNPMKPEDIKILAKIIDGNVNLKKLSLNYCGISNSHLQLLKPILINPRRSQLESFSFMGLSLLSEPPTLSLEILNKNEFLYNLIPAKMCKEIEIANDRNFKKKELREWENFILLTLYIFNALQISSNQVNHKTTFVSLPRAIVQHILTLVSPITSNTKKNSATLCTELIYQNLKKRHLLLDDKAYQSNQPHPITRWWSHSLVVSNKNHHVLFLPNQPKTLKSEPGLTQVQDKAHDCKIM